jgi:nitroreductase
MESQQLLSLFNKRQSIRAYSNKSVDRTIIERCIEAARIAPSACNAQPWKFIVVDDPDLKNKIADLTTTRMIPMNHFTKQAPVHVVVVMEKPNFSSMMGELIRDKTFTLIDVGISTIQFCLQATSESLGTCILMKKKLRSCSTYHHRKGHC